MLDYKNENWWLYNLGITICWVGVIIVTVIYNMNKKTLDNESICILMNIQQKMIVIAFGLLGSREVFARNSRGGYLYYLISAFTFVVLMVRIFL